MLSLLHFWKILLETCTPAQPMPNPISNPTPRRTTTVKHNCRPLPGNPDPRKSVSTEPHQWQDLFTPILPMLDPIVTWSLLQTYILEDKETLSIRVLWYLWYLSFSSILGNGQKGGAGGEVGWGEEEEANSESRLSYRSLQERRDGLEAFQTSQMRRRRKMRGKGWRRKIYCIS